MCLVVPMLALTGCATSGLSGGGDSAVMGDLLTERQIYRAIFQEASLSDDSILVSCVDGIVTLTGIVDTDVDGALAARLAGGVDGVVKVNNNLRTRS